MDTARLRDIIQSKGATIIAPPVDRLRMFQPVLRNPNIREYFNTCLTAEGFSASGMSVANLDTLEAENLNEAAPGKYLFPHGYLVVATSVGGNALCFHGDSDRVYWANHGNFYDDQVSYQDPETREWVDVDATPESIERALVPVADDIEAFLPLFLEDKMEAALDALD